MSKHSVSLEFNTLSDMISAGFLLPGMLVKIHGRSKIDDGMESSYVIVDQSTVSKYDNITTVKLSNGYAAIYYDTSNLKLLNNLSSNGDIIPSTDFEIKIIENPSPHIQVLRYNGDAETLYFPAYINNIPVTVIGDGTNSIIKDNDTAKNSIKKIVTPNTITDISRRSFQGMTNLKRVELTESIQNIGIGAFSKCSNIEYMKIPFTGPNRTHNFTNGQFDHLFGYIFGSYEGDWELPLDNKGNPLIYCQSQRTGVRGFNYVLNATINGAIIIDPDNITVDTSNENLLKYATAIAIFKRGVETSFKYAPSNVSDTAHNNLKNKLLSEYNDITINFLYGHNGAWRLEHYTSLGDTSHSYKELSSLEEWGIHMDHTTFSYGDSISITIQSNGLLFDTSMNPYAESFSGISIQPKYKFVIPRSLTTVELCENAVVYPGAFNRLHSIDTVIINDDNTKIYPLAFFLTELKNIIIHDNVHHIDPLAFAGAYNLQSISIPNTMKTIGMFSFALTSLRNIEIPASVTKIEQGAFSFISDYDVRMTAYTIWAPPLYSLTLNNIPFIETGAFAFNHQLKEITWNGITNTAEFSNKYNIMNTPSISETTPFFNCGYTDERKIIFITDSSKYLNSFKFLSNELAKDKQHKTTLAHNITQLHHAKIQHPISYDLKCKIFNI